MRLRSSSGSPSNLGRLTWSGASFRAISFQRHHQNCSHCQPFGPIRRDDAHRILGGFERHGLPWLHDLRESPAPARSSILRSRACSTSCAGCAALPGSPSKSACRASGREAQSLTTTSSTRLCASAQSVIVFSTDWLTQPVPDANPLIRGLVEKRIEELEGRPASRASRRGFADSCGRSSSQDDVPWRLLSELFHLEPRTLARRMEREDIKFRALVDKAR
jgi:hypothetical protein